MTDIPTSPTPYEWDDSVVVPPEAIRVWKAVEEHVQSGEQVPLSSAKLALEYAREYMESIREARGFVDDHMPTIVEAIVNEECPTVESDRYYLIEECLKVSVAIIMQNMDIQFKRQDLREIHPSVKVLALILCLPRKYFEEALGEQTRFRIMDMFQTEHGFFRLGMILFMSPSACPTNFLAYCLPALSILVESADSPATSGMKFSTSLEDRTADTTLMLNALVACIKTVSLGDLQGSELTAFCTSLRSLSKMRMIVSTRQDNENVHNVYRDVVFKLINSSRQDHRDSGWSQINFLVEAAVQGRAIPAFVVVSNAGHSIANGSYSLVTNHESNGFINTSVVRYEKRVPSNAQEAAGTCLAITRTKAEESNMWSWILTPDTSYEPSFHYSATSSDYNHLPRTGWRLCGNSAIVTTTPPTVSYQDVLSPAIQQRDTLECQLAKWAVASNVIELWLEQTMNSSCCSESSARGVGRLAQVMLGMRELLSRTDSNECRRAYCLDGLHVMKAWSCYVSSQDEETESSLGAFLLLILWRLPDDVAMRLLRAVRASIVSNFRKVAMFCGHLAMWLDCDEDREEHCAFGNPSLSDEARAEVKRLMWEVRCRHDSSWMQICKTWLRAEVIHLGRRNVSGTAIDGMLDANSLRRKEIPRKPKVSIVDQQRRLIKISLPIESNIGDYYVGMHVFATCVSQNDSQIAIASIGRDAVAQCLNASGVRMTVEVILPYCGVWSIVWHGVLLRKGLVETPKSTATDIELSNRDTEQQKLERAQMGAVDELARKYAGEIQSTIRKLRGACSSQLDVDARFSMLHIAVLRGQGTLKELRSLVEAVGCTETSVVGATVLSDALAEAHLPMKDLEAALKSRNKKDRAKSFKLHVSSMLDKKEAASWLESVSGNDLEIIGGDSNRLYQLLVEDKGSKLISQDLYVSSLKAASSRTDLFSKKQIKCITSLLAEVTANDETSNVAIVPLAKTTTPHSTTETNQDLRHVFEVAPTVTSSQAAIQDITDCPLKSSSDDFPLLAFLKEQKACLKGSPEETCQWLVDSEHIVSLEDLAAAVSNDECYINVLQKSIVGVKESERATFQEAVLSAAHENKENTKSPSQLLCPLSHALMITDPVLAADGHTYEHDAITEWFKTQSAQIEAAKQQIASGNPSKKLRAVVKRGIVSPVTHERMENLSLMPNKALHSLAREAAASKGNGKSRVPLGDNRRV